MEPSLNNFNSDRWSCVKNMCFLCLCETELNDTQNAWKAWNDDLWCKDQLFFPSQLRKLIPAALEEEDNITDKITGQEGFGFLTFG